MPAPWSGSRTCIASQRYAILLAEAPGRSESQAGVPRLWPVRGPAGRRYGRTGGGRHTQPPARGYVHCGPEGGQTRLCRKAVRDDLADAEQMLAIAQETGRVLTFRHRTAATIQLSQGPRGHRVGRTGAHRADFGLHHTGSVAAGTGRRSKSFGAARSTTTGRIWWTRVCSRRRDRTAGLLSSGADAAEFRRGRRSCESHAPGPQRAHH